MNVKRRLRCVKKEVDLKIEIAGRGRVSRQFRSYITLLALQTQKQKSGILCRDHRKPLRQYYHCEHRIWLWTWMRMAIINTWLLHNFFDTSSEHATPSTHVSFVLHEIVKVALEPHLQEFCIYSFRVCICRLEVINWILYEYDAPWTATIVVSDRCDISQELHEYRQEDGTSPSNVAHSSTKI